MRTRTLGGAIVLHRFPEQVFIDSAEDLVRQIKGADFFALQVYYINLCHLLFPLRLRNASLLRCFALALRSRISALAPRLIFYPRAPLRFALALCLRITALAPRLIF